MYTHSGSARNPPITLSVNYRKVSDIIRTKSENLSDRRLVLQLHLTNPLKIGSKLRMKV